MVIALWLRSNTVELIIAFILFAVLVAAWIILPGSETEKAVGHSAATPAVGKTSVTA
jgi:hypothetical protein